MLTWLILRLPWEVRVRVGEFFYGGGFHEYLCPCGIPDYDD